MHDIQNALRALRGDRWLSMVAISLLAIAIGGCLAIFLIINGLVLKPLPVQDPNRLFSVSSNPTRVSYWSYAFWREIRDGDYFESAFAWAPLKVGITAQGQHLTIDAGFASEDIWKTLGIWPKMGAGFRSGGADASNVVISERLWRNVFHGIPAVGQPIHIEGKLFYVSGIMPGWFFGPEVGRKVDVIVPLESEPGIRGQPNSFIKNTSVFWLNLIGRIQIDQTPDALKERLRTEGRNLRLRTLPAQLSAQQAERQLEQPVSIVKISNGISPLRTRYAPSLYRLIWTVLAVLLVASISVATLSFARTETRLSEWKLRQWLGASSIRLLKLILYEAALLASIATTIGLIFSIVLSRAIVAQFQTPQGAANLELPVDWRIALFALAAIVFSTVIISLGPLLRARNILFYNQPNRGARSAIYSFRGIGTMALLVFQLATASLLIVLAALFVRSFYLLASRDLGFDADKILVVRFDIAKAANDAPQRLSTIERLVRAARELPGTEEASASAVSPVSNTRWQWEMLVARPGLELQTKEIHVNVVGPGWFRTYGTPILLGRDFSETDTQPKHPVAIVNDAFVRSYLSERPVGSQIQLANTHWTHQQRVEIVGVVANAIYETPRESDVPVVFVPLTQYKPALRWANISIRYSTRNGFESVIREFTKIESRMSYETLRLDDQVRALMAQERVLALISLWVGVAATFFAGLTVLSITSHHFNRSKKELCIRLALGANPSHLQHQCLIRQLKPITIGATLGIALSVLLIRVLQHFLYGASSADPKLLTGCWLFAVFVGYVAAWFPLRSVTGESLAALVRSNASDDRT